MKDPAVLFYTSDFITGTLTMTDAQRGKYIILLCLQHQQGYLTDDDMLNICKTYDEKIFSKFEKDALGYYYNKRMLLESEKRKSYSDSRRKNRAKKEDNICESYDKHMENINEDINKEKKEELLKKREESFRNEVLCIEKYTKEMLINFCNYWTEKNKSRTKMRWELERTFEISRRLVTWAGNDSKFNNQFNGKKQQHEPPQNILNPNSK